ncbi:hypothetical protein Poli38472_012582 [Pythium oligandrum]|uniref:FYVE-type domain-containing protein n=1 Tax=Pythium oligandrum TaxID=41045 RepID=A0A8K1CEI1_PYTOL|nr:hypothetical protein Poli38472_012582 [Pythium oligandrum]|eukprot:TMW61391.1 hypothetical protein Poli38472_012582 [Pythium oligandrum]
MKKTTLLSQTLPSLKLSPAEQNGIAAEVQAILAETLRVEHLFIAEKASLDKRRWKEVKSKDDFRIYKQRKPMKSSTSAVIHRDDFSVSSDDIQAPRFVSVCESSGSSPRHRSVSSTWSSTASEEEGIVASIKNPRLPMIVGSGRIEGTIEDALYGSLAGDEVSWRLRAAYLKDKFADAKILATIQGPTEEDPYRFLGIKWFMPERRTGIPASVINDRDFLVMEAMGVTVDAHGVRHGYYLLHEFIHPDIPERQDLKIIRSKLSLCFISRQVEPRKLHMFARGFIDPRGDLILSLAVSRAAEAMTSTARSVQTSYAKKLAWLMELERQKANDNWQKHQSATSPTSCHACEKPVGLMTSSLLGCQVCHDVFCSKCCVHRNIIVAVSTISVTERLLPFCFACLLQAKELSPADVVKDSATSRFKAFSVAP